MVLAIAIILATVVTVVWWASMWAKPFDKGKPPVDGGSNDDVWPPPPNR